ncbi:type 1 glutamine amidotransferase-like domain-containing protein [Dietzia sp. SLG310A2-38A2]|uniref:Type 1 glutamine amidotransferase-like domain-containing protein n=1 Tax=Dietzia sp. SLG310A2-38A2 TaxID=1630643 RepID=UPI0015FC1875|nr:Type 1 glutamine amidotransferase-like domain-containing protein [Dietzia sp. SLG310A2-38A2]MBB1032524.1 type 1 glutamine amidotransferase-like domain-containing protein [Dietzia sp. SLG310A2-38A2]
MNLLLLSLGVGAVPDFIAEHVARPAPAVRIGYLNDAASPYAGAEFVAAERAQLSDLGYVLTDITAADFDDTGAFADVLDRVDVLYVAGGNTFVLLAALRRHGADAILVERVRAGLPYIGSSAGSVITGPSIEPVSLMDDPSAAPELSDHGGLRLVETVVIPHADGALPPYPPELIARLVEIYGSTYPLTLVNDDQALLVENGTARLVSSP